MVTEVEEEEMVEEDMETEEVKVVTAEEETLAMVARREMKGSMAMEEETQGKEVVEEQVGVEVPVVAEEELHQEDGAVVVQVGPKILLRMSLQCTKSNFSMTIQLRSRKTPQMAETHHIMVMIQELVRSFILQTSATTPMSTLSWNS